MWRQRKAEKDARCSACGGPAGECEDSAKPWFPWRRVCFRTMERLAAQHAWRDLHSDRPWHDGTFTSWAEKRSPSHPYHFDDGVTVGVAPMDVSPDDDFLRHENMPLGGTSAAGGNVDEQPHEHEKHGGRDQEDAHDRLP